MNFFSGRTPEELIPTFTLFRLFFKLKMAVTNDLLHKIVSHDRRGEIKTAKKTKRSHVKTEIKTSAEDMLENRFAVLCDLGEQKSEDEDEN